MTKTERKAFKAFFVSEVIGELKTTPQLTLVLIFERNTYSGPIFFLAILHTKKIRTKALKGFLHSYYACQDIYDFRVPLLNYVINLN